jgi:hypothetical protein
MLADFGVAWCSWFCWLSWPFTLVTTWWKKGDLYHDGGNTEYGHCTVKQTNENVFKQCY